MDWFPATFSIITALGFAFDKILLRRLKISLFDRLQSFFIRLDDIHISNYPQIVARTLIRWKNGVLGESLISFKAISVTILTSLFLVSLLNIFFYYNSPPLERKCCDGILEIPILKVYPIYIINIVTDYLSLIITAVAIRAVLHLKWYVSTLILIFDTLIAIFLMLITFTGMTWLNTYPEKVPMLNTSFHLESRHLYDIFSEYRRPETIEIEYSSLQDIPEALRV